MNLPSRRTSRKLLVATLGLATINYVGCTTVGSGNLMLPPACDGGNADNCYTSSATGTGGAGGQGPTISTAGTGGQGGGTGTGGGAIDAGTPDGG